MSTPSWSVVIPTRDRSDRLARTLAALEAQRDAPEFEIIVADDGSRDDTLEMLGRHPLSRPVRIVALDAAGPAAARNAGVEAASGAFVALLGSDTPPDPGWLAEHARAHGSGDVAVLGRIDWHPDIPVTPFLDFINERGLQFGFALIEDAGDVPFNFWYGSNLSIRRAWLRRHRFDERFRAAAWEDIELGYRLARHGLRLVYEPRARVLHDHRIDLAAFLERQERVGRWATVVRELHPELCHFLGLPPTGPPRAPSAAVARPATWLARRLERTRLRTPPLWRYLADAAYRRGCAAG